MSYLDTAAVRYYSQMNKPAERLLLMMIAEGINRDTGAHFCLASTLMEDCRVKKAYLYKLVFACLQSGELIVSQRAGHASTYYIPIFPGEDGYDPQECHDETHECAGTHTPLSVTRHGITLERGKAARGRKNAKNSQQPQHHRGKKESPIVDSLEKTTKESPIVDSPVSYSGLPSLPQWTPQSPIVDTVPNMYQDINQIEYRELPAHEKSKRSKADARADPTPPPPAPPTPEPPQATPTPQGMDMEIGREQRALWWEVRNAIRRSAAGSFVDATERSHLYPVAQQPNAYVLRIPPQLVPMWRNHAYEIEKALMASTRRGNVLLRIEGS